MKICRVFIVGLSLLSALLLPGLASALPPPAPTLLAPASGASVLVPFTISWSAVSDPGGIVAYNWQLSNSSGFSTVLKLDSTSGQTQGTVSGLATGSYFWRVQAVNSAFEQGAWSPARNVVVTGASAASPGTPSLNPPLGYSTFHPWENMKFSWSAVPGAASYVFEASTDRNFPVGAIRFDNIPDATTGFAIGNPEGNYFGRVQAVSADGIAGVPSNAVPFSVFYGNPVPPPPAPLAPANDAILTLPITLQWAHTINPQPSGYEVQVSSSSTFSTNETPTTVQLTEPGTKLLSLSAGNKFWRVRSHQGMASPTTTAVTAWSATGRFTVSTAPARPVSVTPVRIPLYSGDDTFVEVQLSAAVPAGGASIALASSNPAAAPVPATIAMPGNQGWTQFQMLAGQVTSPTPVTLTATLNGVSASSQFTLQPPSLKTLTITPTTTSGGVPAGGSVQLNGQAPAGGAVVSLSSNSPVASPPATVTVPEGSYSVPFALPTSDVGVKTPVTLSASWNGGTVQAPISVMPSPQPVSLSLLPATVIGGGPGSVDGSVSIASAASFDQFLRVTSNNPTVLPFLSSSVMIPAGSTRGLIQLLPGAVSVATVVRISVSGGGITRSADLTVNPAGTPPPPTTLASFKVSPLSVAGGTPATGTVTLPSAAPAGGISVSLTSNLPGAATVPASVLVPAGASSASFTVTTFPSASTTVQLSARLVDSILFAALGVGPATAQPTLSGLTLNPASLVGGGSASGSVTLSAAAPSGGATVSLSDNTSAAVTPANVTVAAGASSASFTISTSAVTTSTAATLSAVYAGVTRTATLTLNPPASTAPPAPSLLSPARDATPAQAVTFDWADVSGAVAYRIQIDDSSTFAAPFVVDQVVTASQFTAGPLASSRQWWRVQGVNAAGTAGAWSSARRFTPQTAP
ncbi:hypothetical protein [Polaromonas sp.]|uniref:hypothetical protein n=1 Tax=Polaromonas sp. TaxID=1869339 RepID=UPI00286B9E02|nr:hypothetical protein [Polaromonas sp.]